MLFICFAGESNLVVLEIVSYVNVLIILFTVHVELNGAGYANIFPIVIRLTFCLEC